MTDRVAIPFSNGSWLILDREAFDCALVAGTEVMANGHSTQETHGPQLLTSEQMAAKLSVPSSWLEEAARRREVPSVRIGKYVRFDLNEVLTCLNPRITESQLKTRGGLDGASFPKQLTLRSRAAAVRPTAGRKALSED